MRIRLIFFVLLFTALNIHAENGRSLWLRAKSTGTVSVVCAKTSPTLAIAKEELEQGWQGKNGAKIALTITKDKAIKGDGFKLSENEVQANTVLGCFSMLLPPLYSDQTVLLSKALSFAYIRRDFSNHGGIIL